METRLEEFARRPLYVYDLPQDVLNTLQLKDDGSVDSAGQGSETAVVSTAKDRATEDDGSAKGSKACSLCGIAFITVLEQRSHTRSDLHSYNLRQKIRGQKPASEAEFDQLVAELDESLSGSDDSDTEEDEDGIYHKDTTLSALLRKQVNLSTASDHDTDSTGRRSNRGAGKVPLMWFTTSVVPSNTYLGIYRAIFTNEEQTDSTRIVGILQNKQLSPRPAPMLAKTSDTGKLPLPESYIGPHVFLCMIGGGHFAAMVVGLEPRSSKSAPGPMNREATVLAHKTFHRYTTRRKQGGAQSANDSAKGAASSAGAGIRRQMEVALTEEIRELLSDWRGMIDTAELCFVRASGTTNRRTLYGPYEDQVLRSTDPRIRGFPFSTRRATQKELMRCFIELTRVKVREVDEVAAAAAAALTAKAKADAAIAATAKLKQSSVPPPPKRTEEEETNLLHTTQIQALIRRSKVPALLAYLKANALTATFHFYPPDTSANHHAPTPLHLAAHTDSAPLVTGLLLKAGADPTLPNGDGRPAFALASDRATRDAFRIARHTLGEDAFDWSTANVPSALTPDEAAAREASEKAEESAAEEIRRKAENERLLVEGPKVVKGTAMGKAAERNRMAALGVVGRTAQERREEEARGMTPEARMRLERERRARAAEERMRRT